MPPSTSHSPRRKRVRRVFSASATTSSRWKATPFATTSTKTRRRESSPTSSAAFTFSPNDGSQDSELEEDEDPQNSATDGNTIPHAQTFAGLSQLDRPPLTYSSLPPTPISSSPPRVPSPPPPQLKVEPPPTGPPELAHEEPPFSIWDYLREELLATDFDSHQEQKWERVSNFLSMPYAMEKVSQPKEALDVIAGV